MKSAFLCFVYFLQFSIGSSMDATEFRIIRENCPIPNSDDGSSDAFDYIASNYGSNNTLTIEQLHMFLKRVTQKCVLPESLGCMISNAIAPIEESGQSTINSSTFSDICPILMKALESHAISNDDYKDVAEAPSRAAIWGFGFLSVTIISLCSLVGISFLPLMKTTIYDKILLYLVTLAVGTLSSNAIFQLIPEGFGIDSDPMTVWRSAVIFGGFYLFYLTENILERLFNTTHSHHGQDDEAVEDPNTTSADYHVKTKCDEVNSVDNIFISVDKENMNHASNCKWNGATVERSHEALLAVSNKTSESDKSISTASMESCEAATLRPANVVSAKQKQWWIFKNYKSIKTVAWLITIADGIHNFIDGLAIGASFSTSMVQGVSTSIAIFCEEFPHELGDFAILLSAGMDIRQAAFYNFASACCCYIGLVVGILLGHNMSAARWIFALAGGVFLYISLAGMLPEAQAQAAGKKLRNSPWLCLILKNVGLLSGFLVMFVLTLYKDRITFG